MPMSLAKTTTIKGIVRPVATDDTVETPNTILSHFVPYVKILYNIVSWCKFFFSPD